MVLAPRAWLTRHVLASLWPVALPALVHVGFILVIIFVAQPDIFQLWRSLYLERGVPSWVMALVAALIAFLGPVGVIVHLVIRPRYNRASPAT